MNIAYFRKSNYSLQETIDNVNNIAKNQGWKILGEANLPEESGKMVVVCRPDWVKTIMEKDYNLLGFLPCSVSIFQQEGKVLVGTGQPAILRALSQDEDIAEVSAKAEDLLKELIHEAAGVDELKPTGVKLYSTMSCPYCSMEKNWLDTNKVEHQVIYVDRDHEAGEEMVRKTGQMGVPVTEIMFDDAESEYIVGFDQSRLAAALGLN